MQAISLKTIMVISVVFVAGFSAGHFVANPRSNDACEELRKDFRAVFGDPAAEKKKMEKRMKEIEEIRKRQDEAAMRF